jgi:threonine synthase
VVTFTHLECSRPCGHQPFNPKEAHHLCSCGAPLFARYDLKAARRMARDAMRDREPSMWRYRELMPLLEGETPVTLGEGWTPLLPAARIGLSLGLPKLFVKDESLNPTNSFKARGLAAAVTRAVAVGARAIALPSAGNAAGALAAYAARAGVEAHVFLPSDVKPPFIRECALHGARVTLVDGLITDAGRVAAENGRRHGWYDASTLREPYRVEGKKTMAYELLEQLDGTVPDWILYPTGGGTGIVGMWKAFDELEAIGWIGRDRPRMVSVQADGCAPIVRAFERGDEHAAEWADAHTVADGLRVPRAIGDFLVLRAIRKSRGTALAVSDADMIEGMRTLASEEGISAAPESGATLAALRKLVRSGQVQPNDTVVLFNTGGALKYLELANLP